MTKYSSFGLIHANTLGFFPRKLLHGNTTRNNLKRDCVVEAQFILQLSS